MSFFITMKFRFLNITIQQLYVANRVYKNEIEGPQLHKPSAKILKRAAVYGSKVAKGCLKAVNPIKNIEWPNS